MFVHNPESTKPCFAPDNLWCVCHKDFTETNDNSKPSKFQKLSVPKPEDILGVKDPCDHKGQHDRRESLFSEGGCGGVQCSCVSSGRRCSEASCLDTPDVSKQNESNVLSVTDNKSINLSIKSVDSDNILAANDTMSTLLNNRAKKYDTGLVAETDTLSVTSSMRVENESVIGEEVTDSETVRNDNKSAEECGSITSKTSKDIYTKLATLRENKDDAQLSMNNLLSDSSSEQTPEGKESNIETEPQAASASAAVADDNSKETSPAKKKKTLSFRKKKKSKKNKEESTLDESAVVPASGQKVKCCSIQ